MIRRISLSTGTTLIAFAAASGFASVPAVLAQSAVEVAAADAASPASKAPQAAATEPKRLFSVPEDGSGENEVVAPRIVRELMSLRPKEDLIVCIAGCSPGRDRVIYSQPVEETPNGKSISNLVPAVAPKNADRDEAPVRPEKKMPSAAVGGAPAKMNEAGGVASARQTIDLPKGAVVDEALMPQAPNDTPSVP